MQLGWDCHKMGWDSEGAERASMIAGAKISNSPICCDYRSSSSMELLPKTAFVEGKNINSF